MSRGRAVTDIEAVHPGTGEVLDNLDRQPPETLAEALDLCRAREAEAKKWAGAIEAELKRRLKTLDRRFFVFGDWEVEAPVTGQYEWDAPELEAVLSDLIAQGIVRAGEVTDVVTRTPVASRSAAAALLRRLSGDAAEAVKATRTRTEKPGRLTVTRSVELIPAAAAAKPPLAARNVDDAVGSAPVAAPAPTGASRPSRPLTATEVFE
jgi:hypothetical protein